MPPNPAHHALGADDLVPGLYRAHAVGLVRLGLLLLGDRQSAEDVVQDAFMGLYQALPRLRDQDKALPYLRAAVVNGCRSVLRARRRSRLRPAQHESPAWSAESAALAGEESLDPSGRYLLVTLGATTPATQHRLVILDLRTRKLTNIPSRRLSTRAGLLAAPSIAW